MDTADLRQPSAKDKKTNGGQRFKGDQSKFLELSLKSLNAIHGMIRCMYDFLELFRLVYDA